MQAAGLEGGPPLVAEATAVVAMAAAGAAAAAARIAHCCFANKCVWHVCPEVDLFPLSAQSCQRQLSHQQEHLGLATAAAPTAATECSVY